MVFKDAADQISNQTEIVVEEFCPKTCDDYVDFAEIQISISLFQTFGIL